MSETTTGLPRVLFIDRGEGQYVALRRADRRELGWVTWDEDSQGWMTRRSLAEESGPIAATLRQGGKWLLELVEGDDTGPG